MDASPSPAQVWLLRAVGNALVLATAVAVVAMLAAILLEGGRLGAGAMVTGLVTFPVALGYGLLFAVRPSVADVPRSRE